MKNTKTYNIDGRLMQFDHDSFKHFFSSYSKQEKVRVLACCEKIAEELCVSGDAVR